MKGNKGEWSELYTLLKLLGDKELSIGDKDLNKVPDLLYPIIRILRDEGEDHFEYTVGSKVKVIKNGSTIKSIKISDFKDQASSLLSQIKINNNVFKVPELELFLAEIRCSSIKAKSSLKTDIRIVIHDVKTNMQPELGFSIKSQLGSSSTLLNASKSTNFIYKLNGHIDEAKIRTINEISGNSKIRNRLIEINKNNSISYSNIGRSIFKNNLILIDSLLPEIMGEIIKEYYSSNLSAINELVNKISDKNPLEFDFSDNHDFYECKMKKFLVEVAVGMMPATVWTGKYDTTGGYLIVKDDGDILAYHLYNRNEFENYLYYNTKLDTASTNRHNFGLLFKEKNEIYLNLNLQIRFNK